jgi:HlyD family secretion protein
MSVKKLIALIVVVGLLGGGACYYFFVMRPNAAKQATPQTTSAKAERGPIRQIVPSTGRVVANLDVDIKCKASGEIIKLPYDISDPVKKDELLVELDPVDEQRVRKKADVSLSAAKAKLVIATENLKVAESTLATDKEKAAAALRSAKADRAKQLLDRTVASQEEYDTAQTAAIQAAAELDAAKIKLDELKTQETALELKRQDVKLAEVAVEQENIAVDIAQDRLVDTKVTAPMDGVVSARNVQIGQIISSAVSNVGGGTTVMTLSDLSRIFVLASVDETDIGKVQVGQPTMITADAFPGKFFRGKVVRMATRGVNASNVVTFEVKIEVTSEEKSLLRPEMTTNLEIVAAEKDDALMVPSDALMRRFDKKSVTVVKDGGETEQRGVVTGIEDSTRTEIVSGLEEGETVLVRKSAADSRWAAGQRSPASAMKGMMLPGMKGRR